MLQWKPDPTFYPSARLAMQGPAEKLAYVAVFNPKNRDFFVEFDGYRSHQIRLEGGDCSPDSFCYP